MRLHLSYNHSSGWPRFLKAFARKGVLGDERKLIPQHLGLYLSMKWVLTLKFLILGICFSQLAIAQSYDGTGLDPAIRALKKNIQNGDPDLETVSWKLKCTEEELLEINASGDKVLELVRLTAQYGVEKLMFVNPSLASAVAARLGHEAITIACRKSSLEDERTYASANPLQVLIFGYVLHNKTIEIQKAFTDIVSNRPNSHAHQFAIQAIFHELLHLAKLDNRSNDEHNNKIDLSGMTEDVVYSCGMLPFSQRFFGARKADICKTCYIAAIVGAKTILDESLLPEANRFCERQYDRRVGY